MKANELRIGNLVWNDTQNIPVNVDIKIISEQLYRQKTGKGLWKPIPLTEEWLEKFGFTKGDLIEFGMAPDTNTQYYTLELASGHTIDISPDNDHCILQDLDEECIDLPDVKYAHKLQNIIFALTGEELKLKD